MPWLDGDGLANPEIIQDSGGGGRVEGHGNCSVQSVGRIHLEGCCGDNDASIPGTGGLEVVDVGLNDVEGACVVDGDDHVGLGGVDSDVGDVGLDVEGGGVGDDCVRLGRVDPDAPEVDGGGNSDLLD